MSAILKWLKGKTFMCYLPRRGGRILLGKVTARSPEDARKKCIDMIPDPESLDVKRAKVIKVVDPEEGREYDFTNPYFDPEVIESSRKEEKEEITFKDVLNVMNASLVTQLPKVIEFSTQAISQAYATAYNAVITAAGEAFRSAVKQLFGAGSTEKDPRVLVAEGLAEFLKAFGRNPHAVIQALRELAKMGETQEARPLTPADAARLWLASGAPMPAPATAPMPTPAPTEASEGGGEQ